MDHQKEFLNYSRGHLGMSTASVEDYIRKSHGHPWQLQAFTPSVIEERRMNVAQMDVFSRLMMDRIIFLGVPIDDYVANVIQAQLLFMDSLDPKRDVQIYINSPGGSVTAGLGIYDTLQFISPDVGTICTGISASMAAVLLSSGTKGKRTCLRHSRVMIHQPSGGMQGQVSDMEINYKLFKEMQAELYNILAANTEQTYEKIQTDCDRDHWLKAQEAKAYGLVDEVLLRPQTANP
ncbi:MAG: ATP-dependent Clp protease proteolytic subunit [Bacteroidota bacterium]